MKSVIFFIALFVLIQQRDYITALWAEPIDLESAAKSKIVLFSTAWCSYCSKVRRLFEKNDIVYIEYDIEKSQEARSMYEKLGGRGVPVIQINEDVIYGYDRSKIIDTINES